MRMLPAGFSPGKPENHRAKHAPLISSPPWSTPSFSFAPSEVSSAKRTTMTRFTPRHRRGRCRPRPHGKDNIRVRRELRQLVGFVFGDGGDFGVDIIPHDSGKARHGPLVVAHDQHSRAGRDRQQFVERLGARRGVDRHDGDVLAHDFLYFGIVVIGHQDHRLILAQARGVQIRDQRARPIDRLGSSPASCSPR